MDAKGIMGAAVSLAIIGVAGTWIYSKVDEVRRRDAFLAAMRERRVVRAPTGAAVESSGAAPAKTTGNT